jgi:hypothetical protein
VGEGKLPDAWLIADECPPSSVARIGDQRMTISPSPWRRGRGEVVSSRTSRTKSKQIKPVWTGRMGVTCARMSQKAYAAAGVDIDLGNRVKATLPQLLASTRRREVLGKVGGFGGLFALDVKKFRQPVLVSSTDGVGTKLKIAFAMNRHDTVGRICQSLRQRHRRARGGAAVFFGLHRDGQLQPRVFEQLLRGLPRPAGKIIAR